MRRLATRRAVPIALATLVLGCQGLGDAAPTPEPPPRLVVTERVRTGDAIDRVEVLGDVRGVQEVRVFAQVPERIRILHVQEGSRVAAGDPILTLEADLQSSGVVQADAALSAADAARAQLTADLERVRGLVGQGAAPRSQLEMLEAQLRTSDAQVSQARAARRSASDQRARTIVRAPIDGTVALLTVQQGDMIAPSVPVCAIVRTEQVEVDLRVTEQDYVRVRDGMAAEVRPPALPEVERRGAVSRVSPVLDPLTRTARVTVAVDNADGVLRPGMVAHVSIELSRRADTVLAPARALVLSTRTDTEREATVFVVVREGAREGASAVAQRRAVRLGRRYDRAIEITDGLTGGEEVVVQGQHLLREGALVRTASAPPPVAQVAGTER